jgi:hypothetical protein
VETTVCVQWGIVNGDAPIGKVKAGLPSGTQPRLVRAERQSSGLMTNAWLVDLDLGRPLMPFVEIDGAVVDTLKAAMSTKATIELDLGFAVESRQLTARYVGGRGEASMPVVLEWPCEHAGPPTEPGTLPADPASIVGGAVPAASVNG